jgi:tRNA G46 methylase TrmB
VLRLARQIFLAHDIRIGGFETSCEFSLATDWSEYKRWLRSKMEHQYNTRAETDETIAFSRGLDGDLYTVNAALTDNAAKAVRVTFRAMAWSAKNGRE